MSQLLIGTSGYDYPEWKGVFYPADLKRADFLNYYSTKFNALEINNTFYNMPTAERLLSFYERSEGRVQFSIKANRLLTHEVSAGWKSAASDFKTAVSPLQQKDVLAAVLFQLPQSFYYTPENRIYLGQLLQEMQGLPVVVEFRHKEWIRQSVFEGLVQRNVSVAFCDMPQLKNLPNADFQSGVYSQFIGPQAYIRLHGRNANAWYAKTLEETANNGSSRYNYNYSDEELVEFLPVIKTATIEARKVIVFFNNHPQGSGAKNGLRLKELINSSGEF